MGRAVFFCVCVASLIASAVLLVGVDDWVARQFQTRPPSFRKATIIAVVTEAGTASDSSPRKQSARAQKAAPGVVPTNDSERTDAPSIVARDSGVAVRSDSFVESGANHKPRQAPPAAATPAAVQPQDVWWIPAKLDEAPRKSFLITLHNTSINESDVLGDCPMTAQVSLDTSVWVLRTYDIKGQPKKVGGDEYYISYRHSLAADTIIAASNTTDHGNGTYSLQFTTSPWLQAAGPGTLPERGVLIIWLEYSCGVSAMERPLRNGLASWALRLH